MRRRPAVLLILLALLVGCGRQERIWPWSFAASSTVNERLNRIVSVDYRDADLVDVVDHLRRVSGLNMVIEPAVLASGLAPVVLHLEQVPVGAVIDAVERFTGSRVVVRDEILFWSLR